jgi:hypothetical protein
MTTTVLDVMQDSIWSMAPPTMNSSVRVWMRMPTRAVGIMTASSPRSGGSCRTLMTPVRK